MRPSITCGTILILLAGRHRGKRVIFLKQLQSGLLLVSGPYRCNRCPLLRIDSKYVIATETKLNISKIEVPSHINDAYFRRKKLKKLLCTKDKKLILKEEVLNVNEQRKNDQILIDKQLLSILKQHVDRKFLFGYLNTLFYLKNKEYPLRMVF